MSESSVEVCQVASHGADRCEYDCERAVRGSYAATCSARRPNEPPADGQNAGFFVEEIGLKVRSGVWSGIPEYADA